MKRNHVMVVILLVFCLFQLMAVPRSSGKLAGTETAYIDDSYVNIGLMDTTVSLFNVVSIKSNLLFDGLGLYNVGVKAGYSFKSLMDLRLAAGYTWFYLNEKQVLLGIVNNFAKDSGITVNSMDLGIKGQKLYVAAMVPLFDFNVHAYFGMNSSDTENWFYRASLGLEKSFFDNCMSVYVNGGMYFNLPVSTASAAAREIFYNTLVSNLYVDGGLRLYMGDHFNLEVGAVYPGMNIPLGKDPETGKPKVLNLPVIPLFNFAYRL